MLRPLLLALLATPAVADEPGDFDYYVLSLSWSPNWCALTGEDRGDPQCRPSADYGWTLHGLWPQHERGWPADCFADFADPTRRQTEAMVDIMGSSGLAWHQWDKHGSCSGLGPQAYYDLSRDAYESVTIPAVFSQLPRAVDLPADIVEEAFLRENDWLEPDGITVTCDDGFIQEVRICLTRDLDPRACAPDTRRDCQLDDARMEPIP